MADLLCRLCQEENELIVHISEKSEEFDADLCTLLETCGGLKINNDDPFSKYLCQECTNELLITAKFRKKCAEAQQRIDQLKTNVDQLMLTEDVEHDDKNMKISIEEIEQIVEEANDDEDIIEFDSNEDVVVGAFEELLATNELKTTNGDELENVVSNREISTVGQQNETNHAPEVQITYESIIYTNNDPEEQTTQNQSLIEDTVTKELSTATNQILTDVVSDDTTMNSIIKSMNVERVTQFICDICGALFMHAHTVQRHLQNIHKVETILSCDQCTNCFSSNENFNKHTCNITETTKSAVRLEAKMGIPSCTHCGKNFRNRFALEMHIRTHTGERPFACSSCPSTFKTKSALETHKKLHEGRADNKCSYCNRAFVDAGNLKRHLLIHTGERPHVCNICKKSFARVYMLQLHLRTHTGEKPYLCQVCQKSFTQLSTLRSHEQSVHNGGVRMFQCTECPASFLRRSNLHNHVKKKHPYIIISNDDAFSMDEQDDAVSYIVEEEVATEIVTTSEGDLDYMIAETL